LRDGLRLDQHVGARELDLVELERRLRLRDRRLRRREGRLEGARVDREQEVALLHVGTIAEVELLDAAGDLRRDRDDLAGDALSDLVQIDRDVTLDRRRDRDGRRRTLEGRRGLLVTADERREKPREKSAQAPKREAVSIQFLS
jgi:hypothetical protein